MPEVGKWYEVMLGHTPVYLAAIEEIKGQVRYFYHSRGNIYWCTNPKFFYKEVKIA